MASSKKHYRIVIIEPSAIIATGLKELIKLNKEFEIIAVMADCCHSAEKINSLQPDLIILNPSIVDFKSRHAVEDLFCSNHNIPLAALVYQYIEPDILKHYRVVIDITDDQEKIVKKLLQVTETTESHTDIPEGNELSEREKEILICVAKGMINKEIADQNHISIHTVITHRKNITRKTGIKSVAGLTVYALLNNLIEMKEVE